MEMDYTSSTWINHFEEITQAHQFFLWVGHYNVVIRTFSTLVVFCSSSVSLPTSLCCLVVLVSYLSFSLSYIFLFFPSSLVPLLHIFDHCRHRFFASATTYPCKLLPLSLLILVTQQHPDHPFYCHTAALDQYLPSLSRVMASRS